MEIERAVGPRAHNAEIGVAHHDRVGRAPLVAGEQARVDVIHVSFERRMQTVFPALERGKDGDIIGGQRVFARPKGVAELAEIHELRRLRFADDELRAVLDFLVHVREPEGNGVARIVLPLDDFEKLCFEIINQTHNSPLFILTEHPPENENCEV
jgi:hypothetical protein